MSHLKNPRVSLTEVFVFAFLLNPVILVVLLLIGWHLWLPQIPFSWDPIKILVMLFIVLTKAQGPLGIAIEISAGFAILWLIGFMLSGDINSDSDDDDEGFRIPLIGYEEPRGAYPGGWFIRW